VFSGKVQVGLYKFLRARQILGEDMSGAGGGDSGVNVKDILLVIPERKNMVLSRIS
jgi:hypothetical protein